MPDSRCAQPAIYRSVRIATWRHCTGMAEPETRLGFYTKSIQTTVLPDQRL